MPSKAYPRSQLGAVEQAAADKVAAAQREARATAERLTAAERSASEAQERLGKLEELLIAEEKSHVAMAAEIDALKSRVPAAAGGALTPDRARAEAAKAGEAYLAAEQRARKVRSEEAKAASKSAGAALRQAQFDVAVATDAQGVYRLRAEDTLGMVAGRFYGSGDAGRTCSRPTGTSSPTPTPSCRESPWSCLEAPAGSLGPRRRRIARRDGLRHRARRRRAPPRDGLARRRVQHGPAAL